MVAPRERAAARRDVRPPRTVSKGPVAHQSGDRQGHLGPDLATRDDHEAAPDGAEPVHGDRHVGVVHADDADVVAVVADRRGDGAARQPETLDETAPDIAVYAVPGDHGDLGDVLAAIGLTLPAPDRQVELEMLGDDLAWDHADDRGGRPAGHAEIVGGDERRLHAVEADRLDCRTRGEQRFVDGATAGDDGGDGAGLEIVEEDDVGAPAGRDHAAVAETEGGGGAQGRGTIDRERRRAAPDEGADHAVEMALLGDVEGIAIVGAKSEERRRLEVKERLQGSEVFRHGALADQNGHALADLLERLLGARRLVVGADAGGKIAVELVSPDERRMAVDMAV